MRGSPSLVTICAKYVRVESFIKNAVLGLFLYASLTLKYRAAMSLEPMLFVPSSEPPVLAPEPTAVTGVTPAASNAGMMPSGFPEPSPTARSRAAVDLFVVAHPPSHLFGCWPIGQKVGEDFSRPLDEELVLVAAVGEQ
jgi:hypothetical protein